MDDVKSIKRFLIDQIYRYTFIKKITQKQLAAILGITQPKVSQMFNAKTDYFSLHKLFQFMNKLGFDVCITVKPSENEKGKITGYIDEHEN